MPQSLEYYQQNIGKLFYLQVGSVHTTYKRFGKKYKVDPKLWSEWESGYSPSPDQIWKCVAVYENEEDNTGTNFYHLMERWGRLIIIGEKGLLPVTLTQRNLWE